VGFADFKCAKWQERRGIADKNTIANEDDDMRYSFAIDSAL